MKLLIILLVISSVIFADINTSNWKVFTDKNGINSFFFDDSVIYCATIGGISIYDIKKDSFTSIINTDGLSGNYINKIFKDKNNNLWVGTSGSYLNLIKPDFDIKVFDHFDGISLEINDIAGYNDYLYIGCDDGLTIFKNQKFYSKITMNNGLLDNNILKIGLWKDNFLLVLTSQGLNLAKIGNNLANPANWNSIKSIDSKSMVGFKGFIIVNDSIFLYGKDKISKLVFNGDSLNFVTDYVLNLEFAISDLSILGEWIYYTYQYGLYKLNRVSLKKYRVYEAMKLTDLHYDSLSNTIWFSSLKSGLFSYSLNDDEVKNYLNTEGPASNIIYDFAFINDTTYILACGHDHGNTEKEGGISFNNNGIWKTYNPPVRYQDFWAVEFDNNYYWFGSYGSGLVRGKFIGDSLYFDVYDDTNSPLSGKYEHFVPISKIAKDEYNNIWVGDFHIGLFIPVDPDNGEWISFGTSVLKDKEITALTVYFNDVWIGTRNYGLYHLNYGNSIYYPEPIWSVTNSANEYDFFTNHVTDISIDEYGNPWVSTISGVVFKAGNEWYGPFEDPQHFLKSRINAIFIDKYNNKYYGTNDKGLFISIKDTLQWYYFNTYNSLLPSNKILNIEINPYTNEIFVGTDRGLCVINDPIIKASNNFKNIKVYPNPFLLNSFEHNRVYFENLSSYSKIYIFTIDGTLVRTIFAPSGNIGKLSWDGKNSNGKFVPSGVYIYQIEDNNKNIVSGKLIIK